MARRIAPPLQGSAPRGAGHRTSDVRTGFGLRLATDFAVGQLLPANLVRHYALLGAATQKGAAAGLAFLLVVWSRRLRRASVFHPAGAARDWCGYTDHIVRSTFRRTSP